MCVYYFRALLHLKMSECLKVRTSAAIKALLDESPSFIIVKTRFTMRELNSSKYCLTRKHGYIIKKSTHLLKPAVTNIPNETYHKKIALLNKTITDLFHFPSKPFQ